jgi:hypothetical protein
MPSIDNLWEVRNLPGQLSLELHAGDYPAVVLTQGDDTVRIEPAHPARLVAFPALLKPHPQRPRVSAQIRLHHLQPLSLLPFPPLCGRMLRKARLS